MKVLIIDDSHEALELASARLTKEENVDILCADGGQAGLEVAKREKPDLILLDLHMPDISGLEVCRILKSDPNTNIIPIIFLSGSTSADTKVKGLDIGAVDYVTKPFDAFELRARVRAALRTKHMQDLLVKYGQIDPLTELLNRRALTERLRGEWARIRRHGGELSFIIADIDDFKRVNDTHGHQMGDKVLCEVGKVMMDECREADCVTRYGGDEFSILCPEVDAPSAANLAERLRKRIEDLHIWTETDEVMVTVSLGVADAKDAGSCERLIELADEAVYQAKRAGRNRVVVAQESPQVITPT